MGKSVGKIGGAVTGTMVGGPLGGVIGSKVGEKVGGRIEELGSDLLNAPKARQYNIQDASRFDLDRFGGGGFQSRAYDEERKAAIRSDVAQSQRQALGRKLSSREEQLEAERQRLTRQDTAGSLAEAQLKAASERNLAQQLAAARSGRGGNVAAQQRQLAQAQGQAGAELAQQSAEARLAEELQNRQLQLQAQNVLGGQQLQSQGMLAQQLGQEQQLADNLTQQYLAQGFNVAQARQQAQADLEKTQAGLFNQIELANMQTRAGLQGGILSGLGAVGGGLATKSDERAKKNVKSGDKDVKKFLAALSAKSYDYKDKNDGEGKHTSVMAQDLEKTDMGKSFVEALSDGTKMVNYGKGFGAILAAQAHLNKRLEEIEKKKSKKS